MDKKVIYRWLGLGLGVAGAIGSFLVWKRLQSFGIIGVAAEKLVNEAIADTVKKVSSPPRKKKTIAKKKVLKKQTVSVVKKQSKATFLWRLMKPGKGYTQIELQELSHVPYRSVRRYVESLMVEGKLKAVGYGKGEKVYEEIVCAGD